MKIPFIRYAIKRYNPILEKQYVDCRNATMQMSARSHARYDVINLLLSATRSRRYLEIGVRNPADNFNRIEADIKISVDPGIEARVNHATFPVRSDDFFESLKSGTIQMPVDEFDVIFIDGLHLADQVYRDIMNAMKLISQEGYIVLHDCSPPTVFHARESFREAGPATHFWNGTSWKAYQRFRTEHDIRCAVVDVDWGVGVIMMSERSSSYRLSSSTNPFYEYHVLDQNRDGILNLVSFEDLRQVVSGKPDR